MVRMSRAQLSDGSPAQPGAQQGDRQVAGTLDPDHRTDGLTCQPTEAVNQHRHQGDRDHGLQQGGGTGKGEGASQVATLGEQVGAEHGLAVAGACGMEHAVTEAESEQDAPGVCRGRAGKLADRQGQGAVQIALPGDQLQADGLAMFLQRPEEQQHR